MGIYNRKNLALVLALFNVFIVFLGIGLVVPVMPSYMRALHLGTDTMGYLIAMFAFSTINISYCRKMGRYIWSKNDHSRVNSIFLF